MWFPHVRINNYSGLVAINNLLGLRSLVSIDSVIMKLLFLFILQSVSLLHLQPLCEAKTLPSRTVRAIPPQQSATDTRGFSVEYTLITANSPDCEPSLVDNFPVRVQYRKTRPGNGGGNQASTNEWTGSPFAPVPMPG